MSKNSETAAEQVYNTNKEVEGWYNDELLRGKCTTALDKAAWAVQTTFPQELNAKMYNLKHVQSDTSFTKSSRGGLLKKKEGAEDKVIGSYKKTTDRVMGEDVAGPRILPYYASVEIKNKRLIATKIDAIFNEYLREVGLEPEQVAWRRRTHHPTEADM